MNGATLAKGFLSTEFWVTVAVGILVALNGLGLIDLPPETAGDLVTLNGVYIGGRATPKIAQIIGGAIAQVRALPKKA